jgi:hypothetical protein
MCNPSDELLAKIGRFIDRQIVRKFNIVFADLHELDSRHYRVGRNEPGIAAVEASCSSLFWKRNGATMETLGYYRKKDRKTAGAELADAFVWNEDQSDISLDDAIAWLTAARDRVPEEHRSSARLRITMGAVMGQIFYGRAQP